MRMEDYLMNKSALWSAALAGLVLASGNCKESKPAPEKVAEGKCYGINTCKGKGECATKDHGCAGMNTCKGKAWMKTLETDCKTKNGKFEAVLDGKYM